MGVSVLALVALSLTIAVARGARTLQRRSPPERQKVPGNAANRVFDFYLEPVMANEKIPAGILPVIELVHVDTNFEEHYTKTLPNQSNGGGKLSPNNTSTVLAATDKDTGRKVAVKEFYLYDDIQNVRRELQVHAFLKHPNVANFLAAYQQDQRAWLVMELGDLGTLTPFDRSEVPGNPMHLVEVAAIMKQSLMALSYLHSHLIMHRDIKLPNMVATHDGTIKLIDFGFANRPTGIHNRKARRYTAFYAAPEVLNCVGAYSTAVDIWALGITALTLILHPYQGIVTESDLCMEVNSGAPDFRRQLTRSKGFMGEDVKLQNDFINFVAECLRPEADVRSTADDLIKSDFINSSADAPEEAVIRVFATRSGPTN